MKFSFFSVAGAVALIAAASPVAAQSADDSRAGFPRTSLVSANPIGLLFEWYNGEYERALMPTVSAAVAASRFDFFDNDTYTAVDGILRFYPGGRAIRGFAVGLSAGFINVEVDDCFECDDDSESVFTLGVRGDYVWILGRDQRFAVATGIGAKRLFGNDIGDAGLPIGRLSIGYAF
jgi:hypothetical protein